MTGTDTVRDRPPIALWIARLFGTRPPAAPAPAKTRADRHALTRDLAALPPHLRRDIGL